jgi:hypothetical protein
MSSGPGLLATVAGAVSVFTITAHDIFDNLRLVGGEGTYTRCAVLYTMHYSELLLISCCIGLEMIASTGLHTCNLLH